MATPKAKHELHLTRLFDAPVKAVWEAWVDPKQVAQWWGPRGFTITSHSKEVRAGGGWKFAMHGPDGVDYPNAIKYLEVETHKRLVYDHGAQADSPPLFHVTVLFTDRGNQTEMAMAMALPTAEAVAETRKIIKKAGGETTWDRLAEFLIKETTGKEHFVINRTFDAPIDVLYEMWTNPKHVAKWSGPAGAKMEFLRADIRPGGSSLSCMTAPGMGKMFGRAGYLELRKPDRVVYTQQFVDENETVIRHPLAATWPETLLTTVTLTAEGAGHTRVTLTWEVHGPFTTVELQTFVAARAGMTGGWTGSFDNLETYLGRLGDR